MTHGENGNQETPDSFISPRKVALFLLLGIAVVVVMFFFTPLDAVLLALSSIPWWVLPVMMVLSFLNYVIRYVKWQYYLHRIGLNLSHADSFSIFLAGFTLTATPGKIGEAVKGVFINQVDGTPVAKTVPVVVSERVTDLLALVILAMLGFIVGYTGGDQLYLVLIFGAVALIGALIIGNSSFYNRILIRFTSFGPLKRFHDSVDIIQDTMTKTLSPKPMAISTVISIPGWFMECLELWLLLSLLSGQGLPSLAFDSIILLLQATFIHATASTVGALLFTPGGLGGYEGTASALIFFLFADAGIAGAATILIRFVTLWFSVIVGFVALGIVGRRRQRRSSQAVHQA
ncbi:MAG: lysylphosphatidylglycerol synthase transmembrane domain-containing protein [Candidatus Thorarchaeota archaeon]|jgi:uncharacterized protein (TIRG00374 family)